MPAAYPSSHNVFVPSHEATGKLVIDFARNPERFPLNRYVQIIPTEKTLGYYLDMTVEEAGRILHTDGRNFVWPDGATSPEGEEGLESFEFKPVRLERRAYAFRLGNMTVEQATWDIVAQHARIKAQQAMTQRTQLVVNELTTAANYPAAHCLDVTAITGNTGTWAESTTARQDIRRSLIVGAELILDATLSAVNPDDLVLVISSALAGKIAMSQEIVDYIKGSPEALAQVRGELPGRNVFYGLPNKLYGFEVVVEDTRKVVSKKGATTARAAIFPSTSAVMVSRVGGLVGMYGTPNFSTVCLFAQKGREMQVYIKNDPDNERTLGRIVDVVAAKMVAPASGVLFTNCA